MKVCVIGAGIVGCATAYRLQSAGFDVVLLEAASEAGTGTSFANGAQLSYSYVEPLASPATLMSLPKMLVAAQSPLRFKLLPSPQQWLWGLRFLSACTARQARRGTSSLLRLASLSRKSLDEWVAREGWAFAFQRNGKLVLCPDSASLARQRRQVRYQRLLGCSQEILSREECIEREPTLAAYAEAFAGGVWTEDECLGDSYLLCARMVETLHKRGADLRFSCRVDELVPDHRRISGVRTSRGEIIEADVFVIANGCDSVALARQAGIRLPIYPVKGYSLSLRLHRGRQAPKCSVTDLGLKTVFAPLASGLRVAAMAEIVGRDLSIPQERVDQMLQSVERVFPGLCDLRSGEPWAGLRPATPTSIPIVGGTRVPNLYVNSGHGALGFTLAAGSAELLVRTLVERGTARV